jgi:hypothetical protein
MTITVQKIIEDFWFDWEDQELTREERREMLINAGCDPDAMVRKVQLMVLEAKANAAMNKKLYDLP